MATTPDKDSIHKELDLIQDIIKRMAQNSFQVKGWLIGILSAIIVFEKDHLILAGGNDKATSLWLNVLLLLPILCFWFLDSYFLSTERLYREVYKWVIKHRTNTNAYLFDLNTFSREINGVTEELNKPENKIRNIWYSDTLFFFYFVPILFVLALVIFNISK
ncbi:hypothetical protein P1X15_19710 [Runella sp. MFBS21]|uniref:hypothetical protein n=1 Tax=Runella sp. MFBS21 TaxID=3034018 RepID=UPI0023F9B0A3|nr:hypothetical protein [Runella sp. MFBS21]MDF7819858.1 hypothetical protein [Runella sp. MFBS21]